MSPVRFAIVLLSLVAFLAPAPAGARGLISFSGGEYDAGMDVNMCVLTFDDGPSPSATPRLLEMLDATDARVTFFMVGRNAEAFPSIVKRVLGEGHEVGNHSWSHPDFRRLSTDRRVRELERTNAALEASGVHPTLFRPPYGAMDERLMDLAEEMGLRIVTWKYDSLDWKRLPADYGKLPDCYGHRPDHGVIRGIFLFHDIHERTVNDFPRIMEDLKRAGCERFITAGDYLSGLFVDTEPPLLMSKRARRTPPPVDMWQDPESQDWRRAERPVLNEDGWHGIPALSSWKGFKSDELKVFREPAVQKRSGFFFQDEEPVKPRERRRQQRLGPDAEREGQMPLYAKGQLLEIPGSGEGDYVLGTVSTPEEEPQEESPAELQPDSRAAAPADRGAAQAR